jgi:MFS family permease
MTVIIPSALVFLRRQPEDMGLHPDGDPEMTAVAEATGNYVHYDPVWTVGEAMRTKVFWLLIFAYVLCGFGMGGTMHRIPYFVELGFDPGLVSVCFSTDAIAATLMTLTGGLLLDRFPARFVAAGAFAGFAGAMTVMLFASNTVHMFASVILFGFSVGFNSVGQSYLWANYFGRTFLGTIRGVTVPAIFVASAMGGPVVGYIYDFTGSYKPAWQVLFGIFLLAALVMLLATPPEKRDH